MSLISNLEESLDSLDLNVSNKIEMEVHKVKQFERVIDGESKLMTEDEMKKVFAEVKPDSNDLPYFMRKDRNMHLENLHHVFLSDVLGHKPLLEEEEAMIVGKDSCGFLYKQLPTVVQSSKPRIDANGHELHGGRTEKIIREKLWVTPETPPGIETPSRLYVITKIGDIFEEAIDRIFHSKTIGLSLEGEMLGREGVLCWVNICNEKDVFMFDILALQRDAFKFGLRSIFQSNDIKKVVHDCRQIADCLHHQWEVDIVNIWDTMAGDIVFTTQFVYDGFIPQYVRSLSHLLKDYIGIADSHIYFPRYRRSHLAYDSSIWKGRPLPDHLMLGGARNVLYLLALYKVVRKATLLPFERAVHILNTHVRDSDDPDADRMAFETSLLPSRVRGVLPEWRQDRKLLEDRGLFIDGHFIHQTVGNPDPVLIFSKDSMHQAMPHREPFRSIFDKCKESERL